MAARTCASDADSSPTRICCDTTLSRGDKPIELLPNGSLSPQRLDGFLTRARKFEDERELRDDEDILNPLVDVAQQDPTAPLLIIRVRAHQLADRDAVQVRYLAEIQY